MLPNKAGHLSPPFVFISRRFDLPARVPWDSASSNSINSVQYMAAINSIFIFEFSCILILLLYFYLSFDIPNCIP